MSGIGASVGGLRSTHWQLPKNVAFWLLALIYGLLLFSSSAPTPLYGVYQAEWHFSPTTLTIVFGIYGLGVLTALILFGALSDRIGRRPILAAALIAVMASMLTFAAARNADWLMAARLVQGVAVGLASTAASAALLELQPTPGVGALTGATAPSFGLAFGSLITGLWVDFGPSPTVAVFLTLAVICALGLVTVSVMPETAGQNGQSSSLWRPRRISVPRALRSRFALLAIGTAATWAIGGFYLSLGPSLAAELLHSRRHAVGGIAVFALIGIGSFATLFVSSWTNRRAGYFGSVCLVVGLLLVLYAVSMESTSLFFLGSVVIGSGWGPSYMAGFRAVVAIAPPQHKAEMLSALFVVNYLFFILPAIAAGLAATHFGLHMATLAFGAVMTCMGAVAGLGIYLVERQDAAAPRPKAAPSRKPEPCPAPCTVPQLVDCSH